MKTKNTLALCAAIVGLVAMAAANAAPVTYDFTSGFVTVSAFAGSSSTDLLALGTQLQLTGGQVTFDSAALTLPSFQFLDNTSQTVTVNSGTFIGEQITVISWNAVPDATYSSSAFLSSTPPPTYGFTAGKIDAAGMFSLAANGNPLGVNQGPTNFSGQTPSLNGTVTLSGTNMIQLTGITLGTFMVDGQTISLKGDVVFEGATPVPLPGSIWMLGSALALFGFALARRPPASSNRWNLQS
jgi:hypothetical protein